LTTPITLITLAGDILVSVDGKDTRRFSSLLKKVFERLSRAI
jgi:hypothetical protein